MHRRPAPAPLLRLAACLLLSAAPDADPGPGPTAASGEPDPAVLAALGAGSGSLQELAFDAVGETVHVSVELGGRSEELVLWPHSVRSPRFRVLVQGKDGALVERDAPPPATYRGTVVDYPGSVVAASFREGGLAALVRLDPLADLWTVEPLSRVDPSAPAAQHVVFSSAEALPVAGTCGTDPSGLAERVEELPSSPLAGTEDQLTCEIACDTDTQFFADNGSSEAATIADIETTVNGVESIYLNDVDVAFEITAIVVRTAEPDPYTTNDPGDLLEEFRVHWANQQQAVERDIAHLFSGRNFQGSTIGIAYTSTICAKQSGFGTSQRLFNLASRVGVAAHELGHNFSAGHCNQANNCFIMCSGLGGCDNDVTKFANVSKNAIAFFASISGCLIEPVPPDVPVLSAAVPPQVPALVPGQDTYVSLVGEQLHGVTDVRVDGVSLGNLFPPGFTIVSPTRIDLRVPLLDQLGVVEVVATNVSGSDSTSLELAPASPPALQLGEGGSPELLLSLVPIRVTLAAQPGNFVLLWASFTLAPSVVPGVLDFDIGNGFTDLILASFPAVEPQGWVQGAFPVSLPPGTTIYFQAFEYDVATGAPPFESTNHAEGFFLF